MAKRPGGKETGRQGDRETRRQGDRETGRQGGASVFSVHWSTVPSTAATTYPNRIHGTIKHHPFAIGARVFTGLAVQIRQHSVNEFTGIGVKFTVQLTHRDAFRVHHVLTYLLVQLPRHAVVVQRAQTFGQNF